MASGPNSSSGAGITIQPQKLDFKDNKPPRKTQLSFRDTGAGAEKLKKINQLYPGRKILPKKTAYKKGFFEFKRIAKDTSQLVNELEMLFDRNMAMTLNQKKVDDILRNIYTYYRKYKYDPNVRVIYAVSELYRIQVQKPANVLEQTHHVIKEIGQAILNDGVSAYNIKQFINVYNHYVELWKKRAERAIAGTQGNDGTTGKLKRELEDRLLMVDQLKLNEDLLGKKLTIYRDMLTPAKIKDAVETLAGEATDRTLHVANLRLYLITQIMLTLIPSIELSVMIPKFLKALPDTVEDNNPGLIYTVLRKRVIQTEVIKIELSKLEKSEAKGEKAKTEFAHAVFDLFANYKETIEKYLISSRFRFKENSMISPFLGMGKLIIKHGKLFKSFSEESYKKGLQDTTQYLAFFMKRCPRKKPVQLAYKYRVMIQKTLADKGWLAD